MRQAGLCSEPNIHVCLTTETSGPGTGQMGTHEEGTQKGSHEDICSCGFQAALQGHTGNPQDQRSWSGK